MDSKYARTIAVLNTAAKLAKDPDTQKQAVEFIKKNQSYFPNMFVLDAVDPLRKFVPLNLKKKNP